MAFAGIAGAAFVFTVWMLPSSSEQSATAPLPVTRSPSVGSGEVIGTLPSEPSGSNSVAPPEPTSGATDVHGKGENIKTYALSLSELQGLPPDASPGIALELWVAWHRPITNEPRVQRLVREATIERIVPAVTAEGSPTVLLQVRATDLVDLIYGDKFGSLSAALID